MKAFLLAALFVACLVPARSEEKQPIKATAEEVARDYEENEIAADKKYGGKALQVTGKLVAITKTTSGEPVLQLETKCKQAKVLEVICFSNQKDAVAELKKGKEITVTARGLGFYRSSDSPSKDLVRLEHGTLKK